ncbi:MAG: hypothetical protein U0232_15320 [Thermomicrobiales bacterium]
MVTTPKQQLHAFVEGLTDDEAARLWSALREGGQPARLTSPRPLTPADVLLPEPIMPDDESADDLIETVRRWRREGGYA